MLQNESIWARIVIGLIAIGYSLSFVVIGYRIISKEEPHIALLKLAAIGFMTLCSVYIIDIVGAINIEILTKEERGEIFNLIKNIMLVLFAFYFGTKYRK